MNTYSTPGVYTEEVPVLPPSVPAISTAIPAFIGYTERATRDGKDYTNTAVKITTLLEYQELFGNAENSSFTVEVSDTDAVKSVQVGSPKSTLFHTLDLFFKNGGGNCYIISIGNYSDTPEKAAFTRGLEALSLEDEPTLIVLGEATTLDDGDYFELCKEALIQCGDLKDRFCIFDVDHQIAEFRNGLGTSPDLKYGAAYTPFLQTSINHFYKDEDVIIAGSSPVEIMEYVADEGLHITYRGTNISPKIQITKAPGKALNITASNGLLLIEGIGEETVTAGAIVAAWNSLSREKDGFDMKATKSDGIVKAISTSKNLTATVKDSVTLNDKKGTALYGRITKELAKQRLVLPPSAAIAGVYAKTDRERGVWKAPANVSLNAVTGPMKKISAKQQQDLNVDQNGKSINAIRSFAGKGTLVWGARTLDGNDNEWRYVSVRRLFNMIEESLKKATQFAVFESNDAVTWLKVKAMTQSFLYGIWQQGGLAGSTEEQAYFVNVGLGKTMTSQDILEGKMIVEIGLAATRPAEFVVLKFSHKLQEV